MTPLFTPLIEDMNAATPDVIEVGAAHTILVEDLHDHGHSGTGLDHPDGCDCGNCCDDQSHDHVDHGHPDDCDCDSCSTENDFITSGRSDDATEKMPVTTTQGASIEVAHTVATEVPADWNFDFPVNVPTAEIVSSGVGTEGMMQSGYTSGGDAASSFNIMITYGGDLSGELAESFSKAADYFSQIILTDVADLSSGLDDIEIAASLIEIDGAGSILGRAGPQYVRSSNYLPTEAIMEFDVADAQTFADQGLWDDIVFHEMLHTLGFGTLWGYMDLRDGSIENGDMTFNGTHANDVYEDEFASLAAADGFDFGVPIETDGGAGTAGGHWDEGTFDNEIMTGYVNGSNFMSWMSIAALEDMGYDTIYDNPYDANDAFGANPVGDPLSLM